MAREQAERFAAAVAQRLRAFRAERGQPGLLIFAIDTELLGHWWREGPTWLAEAIQLAPGPGIDLVTLPEALERHEPEARPLRASSWGEGKDLRTWDSRDVADLAWGARRLEMRLVRALADGRPAATSRMRAARELLAIQSSDWAFLDQRGQAGDYPFQRVTAQAESLLEAIHSRRPSNPGVRSLAPDLSLSPLMEP
jgi:1,4-alpha-glucan branching enzyme